MRKDVDSTVNLYQGNRSLPKGQASVQGDINLALLLRQVLSPDYSFRAASPSPSHAHAHAATSLQNTSEKNPRLPQSGILPRCLKPVDADHQHKIQYSAPQKLHTARRNAATADPASYSGHSEMLGAHSSLTIAAARVYKNEL